MILNWSISDTFHGGGEAKLPVKFSVLDHGIILKDHLRTLKMADELHLALMVVDISISVF